MLRASVLALTLPLAVAFSPSAPSILGHRRPALSEAACRAPSRVAPCMLSPAAAEAKASLLKVISDGGGSGVTEDKAIDELLQTLAAEDTKFDRTVADGEWALIFERDGKNSPKLQKASAKRQRPGTAFANFESDKSEFYNIAQLFGGKGKLMATVTFGEVEGKASRISCDITDASLKLWKLPTIPLPLRAKGGYLDFLYLDEELRVTRGNRGGTFVHVRPARVPELFGLEPGSA